MSAITVQLPQRLSYPIEEGAALLGISKHTLIRDIRRGHVKTTRYGKRILIPFAELQRLAAEGMRPELPAFSRFDNFQKLLDVLRDSAAGGGPPEH